MSIQVKNLKHIYSQGLPNEAIALDGISFSIEEGEFVGIIGHTGSGKSTLLQHLNGLLKPTEGEIIINGTNITGDKVSMLEIRRKIGLVFQYPEYQLFEETVEKDVAFGPKNLGLKDEEIEERVKEALELVGLDYDEIGEKSPFDLSGGQKRRVAIAGVIAMRPQVLILDEPTAGLDPKAHRDILKMIEEIHKKSASIIILVSHNMNDIAKMSKKVLVMDGGKLIMQGSPKEVFARERELTEINLEVPDVTKLAKKLKEKGIKIDPMLFTVDEIEKELIREIKKDNQ